MSIKSHIFINVLTPRNASSIVKNRWHLHKDDPKVQGTTRNVLQKLVSETLTNYTTLEPDELNSTTLKSFIKIILNRDVADNL